MTRPCLIAALLLAAGVAPAVPPDELDGWARRTVALKAEDQVAAVQDKLRELNKAFRDRQETVSGKVVDGVVRELSIDATYAADIRPLRVLRDLEHLSCPGDFSKVSKVHDLSPLKGMKLRSLNVHHTSVEDLSALEGMPLESINLMSTKVKKLKPIEAAPLKSVHLPPWLPSAEARFLKARRLIFLAADRLDDGVEGAATSKNLAEILSNSKDTIDEVQIVWSAVTDLNFLAGTTVRAVDLRYCPHISPVPVKPGVKAEPAIKPLENCKKLESLSLQRVNGPLDLTPLKGKPLTGLMLFECKGVSNLKPLEGMTTLRHLGLNGTSVTDLGPIAKCADLEELFIEKLQFPNPKPAPVSLKPLEGLTKLKRLEMRETLVLKNDFSPLAKLPLELVAIDLDKNGKPANPALAKVLKGIQTLKIINGMPAAEVLK